MKNSADVAVIGLGAMGKPMAKNLITAGFKVEVWNRSTAKAAELQQLGGIQVSSLSNISAPIILTVLPDIFELREVLTSGLMKALSSNSILVVMGTLSPIAITELATELTSTGVRVVDAPVSGGDVGAQRGELSIMVGGDANDFDRLLPIFRKLGKKIIHVGPLGSGQVLKACNQLIVGANFLAIAEALTLARRSGIKDQDFYDVIANGLAGSKALEIKWEKLTTGNFTPGAKSEFQLRDLKIVAELAEKLSLKLNSTEVVRSAYQKLISDGKGQIDHSGVIAAIE